jgi:hypothetical protein
MSRRVRVALLPVCETAARACVYVCARGGGGQRKSEVNFPRCCWLSVTGSVCPLYHSPLHSSPLHLISSITSRHHTTSFLSTPLMPNRLCTHPLHSTHAKSTLHSRWCPGAATTTVWLQSNTVGIAANAFRDMKSVSSVVICDPPTDAPRPLTAATLGAFVAKVAAYEPSLASLIRKMVAHGIGEQRCVGEYAFYTCMALTSVELPNSVERIGDFAFAGCVALTQVREPRSTAALTHTHTHTHTHTRARARLCSVVLSLLDTAKWRACVMQS